MAMALKGMSVSGVGERHFVINLLKRRREVSVERAMRRMTPLQTAGDRGERGRSHYSKPKLKMTRTLGLHPVFLSASPCSMR